MSSEEESKGRLVIVDSTILRTFLASLPEDSIARFLDGYTGDGPTDSPTAFGDWLYSARQKLKMGQIRFANELTKTGLISVRQSDISNLEKAASRAYFTEDRRERIKAAVQVLLAGDKIVTTEQ